MDERLIFVCCFIVGMIVGFIIGYLTSRQKPDGEIVIEKTSDEDGERELMRWVLEMDLDDIKKSSQIIFSVKDETSKK